MRVVEGEVLGTPHAYVLIGDGPRDLRVLRATAEKYNHSRVLKVPQTPIRGTGLVNVVKSVSTLANMRLRVSKYLVLIDKEHVDSLENVRNELLKFGFEVLSIKVLGRYSWLFRVRKGAKEISIYFVVLGMIKCIEENLARLIEIVYGEKVGRNKEDVNKWLRKHGLSDYELVSSAPRSKIEEAFPDLTKALKELVIST